MARFTFVFSLLSVVLAAFIFQVSAVPLASRQIGDLQCNADRLKTVSSLAATNKAIATIDTSDPATASAVSSAKAGLASAGDGIKTIATSLFTGQAAPADARTQVGTGLTQAQTALSGLDSTDPAVTNTLSKLTDTLTAGQSVVADCK